MLVNTEYKNYTKNRWDWKGSMILQTRSDCDVYPKGKEPGSEAVHASA